ncbi:hypothetical protein EVAR_43814_1 [Eumeta japonica]|uniref:Uncharacterized protein n=1 Tax=Eumeta variegata TaxID=151549 RepID=A0A4C1WZB5_EUMVA|nr:hypothetical protein EVAR_43814_1 [Eumeta japonica]
MIYIHIERTWSSAHESDSHLDRCPLNARPQIMRFAEHRHHSRVGRFTKHQSRVPPFPLPNRYHKLTPISQTGWAETAVFHTARSLHTSLASLAFVDSFIRARRFRIVKIWPFFFTPPIRSAQVSLSLFHNRNGSEIRSDDGRRAGAGDRRRTRRAKPREVAT